MQDAEQLGGALRERAAPATDVALRAQRGRAIGAMVLVALPFLVFWPSTESLLVRWQDTELRTYTHGYLIVAITLWLLWRCRERWSAVPARRFAPGLVLLVGASLAWLIGYRAGLQIVHQALLPVIILAAVLTCFGAAVTGRMFLSLAYLFFAIPVWDAINPLLQWSSVLAVRFLLRLVGIPAFFADNTFQIPAGSFEIAGGCSGLHFFIIAVAIAVLYGELNRDTLRTRVKLVALAGLLAMATNWVRILIIVIAGHLTQMQHYLVSGEHYTFGWFMFAGTMLLYFLIVRRWPVQAAAEAARVEAQRAAAIPTAGFGWALAGLLVMPAWNVIDQGRVAAAMPKLVLPRSVNGWQATAVSQADWRPVFGGADAEVHQEFRSGVTLVEAYAAVYSEQRQGKEIIGYGNSVLGETLRAERTLTRSAPDPWTQLQVTDGDGVWLLWYAYRVADTWHAMPLQLQLDYAVRSLYADPQSAIVALRSPCATDCEAARSALSQFAAASWQ